MRFIVYFLPILGFSIMLNAAEAPPQAPRTVVLISSDGKVKVELPLEIAQESEFLSFALQNYKLPDIKLQLPISSEVLSELAQAIAFFLSHQGLSHEQSIAQAEKEIPIQDMYEFTVAVKFLEFKPLIDFIDEKYKNEDYSFFPTADHEYYMNLIQKLNPTAYKKLKACEAANHKPCLEMAILKEDEGVVPDLLSEFLGYPILAINPGIKLYDEESQKNYLKTWLELYIEAPIATLVSANELKINMALIKNIAPSLYEAIVEVDPTGVNHIKRHYEGSNTAIRPSQVDGLPVIYVGAESAQVPIKYQRVTVAHELGHYALGHFFKKPIKKHKVLEKEIPFEIGGTLPFKKSFEHSFSRIQEFEADRFAVIEMGVSIDDAIAQAKSWIAKEEELLATPEKETFKRTHPFARARIQQFEDLRREVELHKAQKRQTKPIDWKSLAAEYLKDLQ